MGGVGRELVSFLVFRFVCFWFGGGNRLERERREFEPVPVSSAAGRLREQDRGGGAATNGLITYQLSDHPTSPRQSSDRQDKEDKEDKARQASKQVDKLLVVFRRQAAPRQRSRSRSRYRHRHYAASSASTRASFKLQASSSSLNVPELRYPPQPSSEFI